jgi:hypothetical protein
MEEETTVDKDYLKGFNSGYIVGKYKPELSQQLKSIAPTQDLFATGLTDGIAQHEREATKEQGRLDQLNQIRDSSKGEDRDIDVTR